MKQCTGCQKLLPFTSFNKRNDTLIGFTSRCKSCVADAQKVRYVGNKNVWRDGAYKRDFGISLNEYEALLNSQNGSCSICKSPETGLNTNHFAVDHDHESGRVRGLLCSGCNLGLGKFKDDPKLLRRAVEYLEGAACQTLSPAI